MTTTEPRPVITAQELGYDVRPIAGLIGAEILGIDLSQPLDAVTVAAIRAALVEHKVIFFRDQDITQAQHVAFGRYFGEVTPAHPTLPAVFDDFPEILLLDNQRYAPMGAATVESRWHTDVTFVPNPPMGSILRGVVVPPYGGDTQFINLAVAYDRLSDPIKQLVDGLHAVHHNTLPISRGEMSSSYASSSSRGRCSRSIPWCACTRRAASACCSSTRTSPSHIFELSRQESGHLLAMLYEHQANAAFTCRFRWQPGSIAFWDNRATAHLVPTDVPVGHHRSMQRITIAGDVPVGPDGSKSYALTGDTFE